MSTSIWNKYSELTKEPTLMERILENFQHAASEIIIATVAGVLAALVVIKLSKE